MRSEVQFRRAMAVFVVALLHLTALWWLTSSRSAQPPEFPTLIDLTLEQPLFVPPVIRRPALAPTDPQDGGASAQASPSLVHRPPVIPERVETPVVAPVVAAPEQPLVVGSAAIPGSGRGEATGSAGDAGGAGAGAGSGSGAGPGTGQAQARAEAQLISRPSASDIRTRYPSHARRMGLTGRAEIACIVRPDTRLERCRVVRESPANLGFGYAGLELARQYRFRPPVEDGRAVTGHVVAFTIDYVRP